MRKIKYVAVVLGVLALGFGSTQALQRAERPHRPGRDRMMLGALIMADQLGLTAEQQAKLRETRLATRKETIELNAKLRILRLELRELMQADQPDQKAIQAKVKAIGDLRTKLQMARINGVLSAKSVLTAEQKEKMKKLRKRLLRRRLERRLRGRAPRPMPPRQPLPPQQRDGQRG